MKDGGNGVDEATKDVMVARFRAQLDGLAEGDDDPAALEGDEATDLRALHVELAALRTEVRAEARMFKDGLDQLRASVARAETAEAAARQEAERLREELRAERRDQGERVLAPLLADLIGLRDRLEAGLALPLPAAAQPPWYRRLFAASGPATAARDTDAAWREGVGMTLDRLDRILKERGVEPMELEGRPFDPRVARALATAADGGRADGIVVSVIRGGFTRDGTTLRVADVVVNKLGSGERA